MVLTKIPGLTPFWESQDSYWPSSQTTATSTLQYSYPEFNGLDLNNTDAVRNAIGNYINQQYGGGGGAVASLFRSGVAPVSRLAQAPAAGGAQAPVAKPASTVQSTAGEIGHALHSAVGDIKHAFHSRGGPHHTAQKPEHGPNTIRDWTCRIQVKKYELSGSFFEIGRASCRERV